MEAKFSNRVKEVISLSREEAIRLGHDYIGTEHLLLGMIREGEGTALGLLKKLGVATEELKFALEQATRNTASTQGTSITGSIPLTKQTEKVLKITYLEAKIFKSEIIGTEHLLLSILRDEDNISSQILSKFNVNYETVRDSLDYHGAAPGNGPKAERPEADDDDDRLFGQGQGGAGRGQGAQGGAAGAGAKRAGEKSRTPVLDNFGRDLTKLAEE
jgi:ATP-dependent Clp protease ATP-binding subunit ClpC